MTRAFTLVNTQLQKIREDDSDLSDSEEEDEASHFQISNSNVGKSGFQFSKLNKGLEPHIINIFNQSAGHNVGIKITPDLMEVIILYIHSILDIFCNQALVEKTIKSKTKLQLKINSGTMTVSLLLQVELLLRGTKRKPVMSILSQQRHHYLTW